LMIGPGSDDAGGWAAATEPIRAAATKTPRPRTASSRAYRLTPAQPNPPRQDINYRFSRSYGDRWAMTWAPTSVTGRMQTTATVLASRAEPSLGAYLPAFVQGGKQASTDPRLAGHLPSSHPRDKALSRSFG
jgi:hypothetical protein